jgi:1,4-dihydroxy-6-naphthoate synthase
MIRFAHTPCPNDTFAFHALAAGPPSPDEPAFEIRLHDIAELNRLALDAVYSLTKLSVPAWFKVKAAYEPLPVGAALGFGCGPLLVARTSEIAPLRIAVPGELTTADLLLSLWSSSPPKSAIPAAAPPKCALPGAGGRAGASVLGGDRMSQIAECTAWPSAAAPIERVMMRYDAILASVASGEVDAGVVIHEGRFVFEQYGLVPLVDLGKWWEETTGLPVPLALIAGRRALGGEAIAAATRALRRSIETARRDPSASLEYVRRHAQELDDEVIRRHIETFVTDFSLDLGETGHAAIAHMEAMAREKGLVA